MALYLIGDLQSCCTPFKALLNKIDFSPSRDHLILLGDLINRGPETIETVETILSYGDAIQCLIGNHDMHYLGVAYGLRKERPHDTLTPLLTSPKKDYYIDWFRNNHMALLKKRYLMVHAGVPAEWSVEDTLHYASEVEDALRGPYVKDFLNEIFGDTPDKWSPHLKGIEKLRFIVNALTRMRFCYKKDGRMDFAFKKGVKAAPSELTPWFDMPHRKTENDKIAFGHWSTLESISPKPNLLALDTGSLWGGSLTAARIRKHKPHTITQIKCDIYVDPISDKPSKKKGK